MEEIKQTGQEETEAGQEETPMKVEPEVEAQKEREPEVKPEAAKTSAGTVNPRIATRVTHTKPSLTVPFIRIPPFRGQRA